MWRTVATLKSMCSLRKMTYATSTYVNVRTSTYVDRPYGVRMSHAQDQTVAVNGDKLKLHYFDLLWISPTTSCTTRIITRIGCCGFTVQQNMPKNRSNGVLVTGILPSHQLFLTVRLEATFNTVVFETEWKSRLSLPLLLRIHLFCVSRRLSMIAVSESAGCYCCAMCIG